MASLYICDHMNNKQWYNETETTHYNVDACYVLGSLCETLFCNDHVINESN
jgi:hypothetical protein